jgi:PadR family transcriptional regulator, regulatory protein PadR
MEAHQPYDADLLRGNTDSLLLCLINERGSTYGYELIKEIGRRSKGYFRFREGTVYPALRKLEADGLVRGEWRRVEGGQERRYYVMTQKGRALLRRKIDMWRKFSSAMTLVLKPAGG